MIVFIPIKEVSQRVPRKNFRLLNGAPLYKHVLRKYKNHKVYVDTDSEEIIKECATDPSLNHVTAYKRLKKLCGHKISVCNLIVNFIQKYDISEPIAQIHVTSPFLKTETVEKAYSLLIHHDSIVSCNKHNSRFWRKESYGFCPVNHNPLKLEQTQDLPGLFEENSCFYIFKPNVIKRTGNRIGISPFFYEIRHPQNLDIDTESDWDIVLKQVSNEN
jgi:CMP-N-acetylneuraminic acid synthetase